MDDFPSHVFLTGATGFVGKSVLEKIIRSLPDHVVTYVLIRSKPKAGSIQERLEEEIFSSQIFARVKKEKGFREDDAASFNRYMKTRVVAIEGDVSKQLLGISEDVLNRKLRPNVEVAIHCAASVDFDERLDLAIGNNIFGALETLQVCRSFTKIRRLVHVSTAYVSANQTHRKNINEEIPNLNFDYEGLIRQTLALKSDLKELELFTQKVLAEYNFPNTYTITKAISEVLLSKTMASSGNSSFDLHIVRPSIIGASWKEPFPGWVDAVSAATAVFLTVVLGILTMLPGDPRGVADVIPVDIVANHILLACTVKGEVDKKVRVSHCCSSVVNPVRWRVVSDSVVRTIFSEIGPPKSRLQVGSRSGFTMLPDSNLFKLEWAVCYDLPTFLLNALSKVSRSPKHIELAKSMSELTDRASQIAGLFTPFTSNEYFFGCDSFLSVWATKQDQFNINVGDIAWQPYFYNYVYGLQRFILHEDLIPVTEAMVSHTGLKLNTERLVHWDADHHFISFPGLIPDITWAYTQSRPAGYTQSGGVLGRALGLTGWREGLNHEAKYVPRKTIRSPGEMMNLVMSSPNVRKAIKDEAIRLKSKGTGFKTTKRTSANATTERKDYGDGEANKQYRVEARKHAESIYGKLASTLSDQPPRSFGWFLRKIWRQLFDGIQVHELGLDRIRSLLLDNSVVGGSRRPIVLVPSHRSYVDFLVLSYVMFAYNIPVPHIAASEDFLNMGPVSNLLRSSGAFFIRRDTANQSVSGKDEDHLYREIFKEYLFRLLEDGQMVEFFLEGTRSRSGKSIPPKSGMMKMFAEAIALKRVEDVFFVPVSVSYERPLEVSLYAEEMLGSSKPRESLWNLLKGASALGKRFGTISLQFTNPMSLRTLLATETNLPPAVKLVRAIDSTSVCYTTHLVATLLLMYRNGATFEQLLRGLAFIRQEIYKRDGRVMGIEGQRPEQTLKRALDLLGPIVCKRDVPAVYQVEFSAKNWTNFLALAYYRNHIVHLFADESIWAAAIHSRSKLLPSTTTTTKATATALSFDAQGKPHFLKSSSDEYEMVYYATRDEVLHDVTFLRRLLEREFIVMKQNACDGLADLERREVISLDVKNNHITVKQSRPFALLCSMVWPLVDGYFIAATALFALLNGNSIPLTELNSRMLALGETLYQDGVVVYYESCSSGTLANALQTFHEWEVVQYKRLALPKLPMQGQQYRIDVALRGEFDSRDALRSLVSGIDKFRKRGHRDFSIDEAGTPFGVAHFPVLARM